jgi:hypothetical protein
LKKTKKTVAPEVEAERKLREVLATSKLALSTALEIKRGAHNEAPKYECVSRHLAPLENAVKILGEVVCSEELKGFPEAFQNACLSPKYLKDLKDRLGKQWLQGLLNSYEKIADPVKALVDITEKINKVVKADCEHEAPMVKKAKTKKEPK